MSGNDTSVDLPRPEFLFSVIFLSFLAIGTVLVNGFVLFAIFKDPLKCFKTPLALLISGLMAADLITGISLPFVVASLFTSENAMVKLIGDMLPFITINASFCTILALAVAQLIALGWSSAYERWVTNTAARICIIVIWIWCALVFPNLIRAMDFWLFVKVDLIMHTTFTTVALVIIYIVTYFVYKKAIGRSEFTNAGQTSPDNQLSSEHVDRQFLIGTFILTLSVILLIIPQAIAWYIVVFSTKDPVSSYHANRVAIRLTTDLLYLKSFLDPFIFIWRLPKYRRAMIMVYSDVFPCCGCSPPHEPAAQYHAAETEVTALA